MRIDGRKTLPAGYQAMIALQQVVNKSKIDPKLLMLVVTRASQINGCAHCLDMHTKDARKLGETEQRLYALSAWRETPFYTERERAALEWTEALTMVSQNEVSDSLYDSVRKYFDAREMVALSMAIVAINGWNRLSVGFRTVPGSYNPQ